MENTLMDLIIKSVIISFNMSDVAIRVVCGIPVIDFAKLLLWLEYVIVESTVESK